MLIYALCRQLSRIEFTHFLSWNPPECQDWGAGGSSQSWQFQDFHGFLHFHPSLMTASDTQACFSVWTDSRTPTKTINPPGISIPSPSLLACAYIEIYGLIVFRKKMYERMHFICFASFDSFRMEVAVYIFAFLKVQICFCLNLFGLPFSLLVQIHYFKCILKAAKQFVCGIASG